jgi:hypothetical protein
MKNQNPRFLETNICMLRVSAMVCLVGVNNSGDAVKTHFAKVQENVTATFLKNLLDTVPQTIPIAVGFRRTFLWHILNKG